MSYFTVHSHPPPSSPYTPTHHRHSHPPPTIFRNFLGFGLFQIGLLFYGLGLKSPAAFMAVKTRSNASLGKSEKAGIPLGIGGTYGACLPNSIHHKITPSIPIPEHINTLLKYCLYESQRPMRPVNIIKIIEHAVLTIYVAIQIKAVAE